MPKHVLPACLHVTVCVSVLGGHLKYSIFLVLFVARQIPRRKRKLANDLSETRASKFCKRDNAAYVCYLIFLPHTHIRTHMCVFFLTISCYKQIKDVITQLNARGESGNWGRGTNLPQCD